MPFLPPNQQRQSTEVISNSVNMIYKCAQWLAKAESEAQEEKGVERIGRPAGNRGS